LCRLVVALCREACVLGRSKTARVLSEQGFLRERSTSRVKGWIWCSPLNNEPDQCPLEDTSTAILGGVCIAYALPALAARRRCQPSLHDAPQFKGLRPKWGNWSGEKTGVARLLEKTRRTPARRNSPQMSLGCTTEGGYERPLRTSLGPAAFA